MSISRRNAQSSAEGLRGTPWQKRGADSVEITPGSTNVVEDLGYPDAVERETQLRLAYALTQVLLERNLTPTAAAKVLGLTQPRVSTLRHYKLADFWVERLMTLLTDLDEDVEVVIQNKPRSRCAARTRLSQLTSRIGGLR